MATTIQLPPTMPVSMMDMTNINLTNFPPGLINQETYEPYFPDLNSTDYSWVGDINTLELIINGSMDQMLQENASTRPYYGDYFSAFKRYYALVHGYLGVIVCVFGIIANVLNIIVLTRKDMVSPTNFILTGLAVADMLVMVVYLPFCVHFYIYPNQPREHLFSYSWSIFTLFKAHFTVVCHTISIWLTVALAVWRFLAVSFPASSKTWCSMPRAKLAILCTYINCVLFCLPVYVCFTITKETAYVEGEHDDSRRNYSYYMINFSEFAKAHNGALRIANFWIFSVLTKLIPCIALTGLSFGLIKVLYETNKRKQRLKNRVENDKTHDRTTRMLLAILILFLITEFPSGILALLSGILGNDFFLNVYKQLGELMDMLALVNSAINFILYCSMSRQFRETFSNLFTRKILSNWMIVPTEPNTTVDTTCV